MRVFACCSVGIGRWYWAVWESEEEAREREKPVAEGYEKSAKSAEEAAERRAEGEVRKLPAKWAKEYKGGGKKEQVGEKRSRLARPKAPVNREGARPKVAFLYAAVEGEALEERGQVVVSKHRIVKQNARKVHVEAEEFDEEGWEGRKEEAGEKVRTVAVDRGELRKEGRFRTGRGANERTFYESEDAGIRDVEREMAEKYEWCGVLGVGFPCGKEEVKAAYRRRARGAHPDGGGEEGEFREVERAYRAAMAYFEGV